MLVVAISASGSDAVVGGGVEMNVDHRLRVWEPSAGDELVVSGSGGLLDATGTGVDEIRTFPNPPAPKRSVLAEPIIFQQPIPYENP